ncbi:MAG TPA: alpha/beta fold hydrolase, partial [Candidatus Methylomirabilis sp.]|nr:alpha/beta fold hydrolase [Candidatus Methylomirabilis sp.]
PGTEATLEIGGKAVQLFTGGDGAPLLYLHGAGTYWWMPVHDLLAARRRVYLPVHPGFGASPGLDEIESMEDLVFHTVDVLDALGVERADVIGLSLGGWLAAELALRHPARVRRLVLVDAAGTRVPGVVREDLFMATPARARQLLFAEPASPLAMALVPDAPPPERLEAALRGREAAARLLWNPHAQYRKLTSRLGRIAAPTLVVWGAHDRLLPRALGEAYQRGIPGAALAVLDGCGHLPPLEQPERFARVALDFLER